MGFFDDFARRMAELNIAPEAIAPMITPKVGRLMQAQAEPNAARFGPQTMQGVPRSPDPQAGANSFSLGDLLQQLFQPMPTNESFPTAREEWNRPVLPGFNTGAPTSQHMTAQAPAGGNAPM